MKKLLLSLGTVAAVVAPVASVIACGSDSSSKATSIKDSELNSNEAIKALGAKDGSYTSTIKMGKDPKDTTGSVTLTFTATKAGKLDGVDIKANSKVTIIENIDGLKVNGIKVSSEKDEQGSEIYTLIGSLIKPDSEGPRGGATSTSGKQLLTSTKTAKELKDIKYTDFQSKNPKEMSEFFGVKQYGITVPGKTAKWDPATLTLSSTQTKANKIINMSFVITPAAPTFEEKLEERLGSLGYKLKDGDFTKVIDALNTNGGKDATFEIGTQATGKLISTKDAGYSTHNGDDFFIVINGGKVKDAADTEVVAALAAELADSDTQFVTQWGATNGEFDQATSIIYLHHTGGDKTDATTTVTVVQVVKNQGKLFELSGKAAPKDFGATYTLPTNS